MCFRGSFSSSSSANTRLMSLVNWCQYTLLGSLWWVYNCSKNSYSSKDNSIFSYDKTPLNLLVAQYPFRSGSKSINYSWIRKFFTFTSVFIFERSNSLLIDVLVRLWGTLSVLRDSSGFWFLLSLIKSTYLINERVRSP